MAKRSCWSCLFYFEKYGQYFLENLQKSAPRFTTLARNLEDNHKDLIVNHLFNNAVSKNILLRFGIPEFLPPSNGTNRPRPMRPLPLDFSFFWLKFKTVIFSRDLLFEKKNIWMCGKKVSVLPRFFSRLRARARCFLRIRHRPTLRGVKKTKIDSITSLIPEAILFNFQVAHTNKPNF